MVDRESKARGFGFVTFKDSSVLEAVLEMKDHQIDNKIVELKPSVPKLRKSRKRIVCDVGLSESNSMFENNP
jgi:RNA recognition motif-containing protein